MKNILLLAALALVLSLRADSKNAVAFIADTEQAIERAYLRADAVQLSGITRILADSLAADPENPALLYESAFAHYAATAPLRVTNNKESIVAEFEKAVALLERVKGQPWEAEAAALHGSILGSLIGFKGGMSGMTLGPKSNRLMAGASKALPGNPRVLLFRGISLLNTPRAFGGDPAEGGQLLQQSADLFAAEVSSAKRGISPPGPRWGHADALTWLGIAKKKTGDLSAARDAWQQALALEPDFAWVKFALLPSLDQKNAR